MDQTLHTVDGRPVLRIKRRLAHPPEKVWRAVTEPDQLSQWYPFTVTEMDLRLDGTVRFDDGEGAVIDAVITELEPPRLFAFSVPALENFVPGGRESENQVHIELLPDSGGCLLIFSLTFDDRPAAPSYATGWHLCLDVLDMVVEGRTVEWPTMSPELYEEYVQAFGLYVGSAEDTPDGWQVRFDRQLMGQSIEAAWSKLTEDTGTPVVGGQAPQASTTGKIPPGGLTAVEEPTLLEYDWHVEDRPVGRVRWELSPGPGGARITLTQTGPSELAEYQATALAAWQAHIEDLAKPS